MNNYVKNKRRTALPVGAFLIASVFLVLPEMLRAQDNSPSPAASGASAGQPNESEMMKEMMEMGKLNENHKLLASLDGNWSYTVKMWMNGDTSSKPMESHGTAVRKSIWGGRYFTEDVTGSMQMPGENGKMKTFTFRGHGTEGYDNATQKFEAAWYDNMGTGIMMMDGTYDAGTKTFTFTGDEHMTPNLTEKVRETLKVEDKDHMTMEWYENRGGQEQKTMEIDYKRQR